MGKGVSLIYQLGYDRTIGNVINQATKFKTAGEQILSKYRWVNLHSSVYTAPGEGQLEILISIKGVNPNSDLVGAVTEYFSLVGEPYYVGGGSDYCIVEKALAYLGMTLRRPILAVATLHTGKKVVGNGSLPQLV